jgi:hypothetical protein
MAITKGKFYIEVPDSMEWELHNALEDHDDSIFSGMSEVGVQSWVADTLDIGMSRVYVEKDDAPYPYQGD